MPDAVPSKIAPRAPATPASAPSASRSPHAGPRSPLRAHSDTHSSRTPPSLSITSHRPLRYVLIRASTTNQLHGTDPRDSHACELYQTPSPVAPPAVTLPRFCPVCTCPLPHAHQTHTSPPPASALTPGPSPPHRRYGGTSSTSAYMLLYKETPVAGVDAAFELRFMQ